MGNSGGKRSRDVDGLVDQKGEVSKDLDFGE